MNATKVQITVSSDEMQLLERLFEGCKALEIKT